MNNQQWMDALDANARGIAKQNDPDFTNSAIVKRLREIYDEIKEQAGDSSDWLKQYEAISHAADRIVIFADCVKEDWKSIRRLSGEIDTLRAERDQARREVCELRADIGFSRPLVPHMLEFAASRGWDCFPKKEKP